MWLLETFASVDFLVFFFLGVAGMVGHWAKRWVRLETDKTLWSYLFRDSPRYTLYAFLTYVGAVLSMVIFGDIDFASKEALGLAFTTGYSIDSAINKDFQHQEEHDDVRDRF